MTPRRASRENILHHAKSIPLPGDVDVPTGVARARLSWSDEWPEHHAKPSEGRRGAGADGLRSIKVRLHIPPSAGAPYRCSISC